MKRNRVFRLLASLTVVVLCMTAFLKAYASGLITLPDGMMEAEAVPDPDDADVEGMEDGEDEA